MAFLNSVSIHLTQRPCRTSALSKTVSWKHSRVVVRAPHNFTASLPTDTNASPAHEYSGSEKIEPSLFACISCKGELPSALNDKACETCGTEYEKKSDYVDFISGAAGKGERPFLLQPLTQQ
eukprot:IDg20383t1